MYPIGWKMCALGRKVKGRGILEPRPALWECLATIRQAVKPRLREGKEANHAGLETYLVAGPEL